jgi:hypothetical protein
MSSETVCIAQPGNKIVEMDKIKRYGWTVKDKPGVFKWISKQLLNIDPSYQRSQSLGRTRQMAANWSWVACGTLTVAMRDGDYYIIEGQHRWLAALNRSDIIDLPCMVFDINRLQDEARGFLNSNIMRSPIRVLSSYHSRITAKDEETLYLEKLFKDLKMHAGSNNRPLEVTCIGSCFNLMKLNRLKFEQTMEFLEILCKDHPINRKLLESIYYLNAHLTTDLSDKRLRERILNIGPEKLLKSAARAAAFYTEGGAKVWAIGMLEDINKGLRHEFKFKEE